MRTLLIAIFLCFSLGMPTTTWAGDDIPVILDGKTVHFANSPLVIEERIYVPMHDLFTALNANVSYNGLTKNNKVTKGKTTIVFQVDSSTATVNGGKITLDAPPIVVDGITMVPLRMATSTLNASVAWDNGTVYINSDGSPIVLPKESKVTSTKTNLTLDGKEVAVNYVKIPQKLGLQPELVIGQNSVGQVEELFSLAERSYALVAINGGYFQSYDASKSMDPYSTLIKNGKLIHRGDTGSTIGFTADGQVKMDMINIALEGTVGKKSFAITNINHTPPSDSKSITVFTPERGKTVGFSYGLNVVIQGGEVVGTYENNDTPIPNNGYVLNLIKTADSANKLFEKGAKVEYKATYTNSSGTKVNWSDVQTAIGAGPLLVKNNAIVVNPSKEGFLDEKSFSLATTRSAVGVTESGDILLVAGISCTLDQMADVMCQLGAADAICMDGGASSGLYANGKYVVKPTRPISNALIFK